MPCWKWWGMKVDALNQIGGTGEWASEDAQTINSLKATHYKSLPVVCYGICSYHSNAMLSSNPHSGIYEATTARTLDLNGGNPACNQGGW
jgi:DNA (cytosine-5)-methyltransferase 1